MLCTATYGNAALETTAQAIQRCHVDVVRLLVPCAATSVFQALVADLPPKTCVFGDRGTLTAMPCRVSRLGG